uniref:Uncharacterized protein n=1 Tax=Eptatretus burgeri TaxID=7764 RepID=A0A8C4QDL8_EPTBU
MTWYCDFCGHSSYRVILKAFCNNYMSLSLPLRCSDAAGGSRRHSCRGVWFRSIPLPRCGTPHSHHHLASRWEALAVWTSTVHGRYSHWLPWGACSVDCGRGSQERVRLCNNPWPANGGRTCQGPSAERQTCHTKPCPGEDQRLSGSSSANNKRASPRSIIYVRTRSCTQPSPQHGGSSCKGSPVETILCDLAQCPVHGGWSSWLSWETCSRSCGEGLQTRQRSCNDPAPAFDGESCRGSSIQTQICNSQQCPVDGVWSPWGDWMACSASCGGGVRNRIRACNNPTPNHGGRPCEDSGSQIEACLPELCPGCPAEATLLLVHIYFNNSFVILTAQIQTHL